MSATMLRYDRVKSAELYALVAHYGLSFHAVKPLKFFKKT